MPSPIQCAEFELDLGRYTLMRAGRSVRLEKQPMELLILLVEKRGQLVTREEIVSRLWGNGVFLDTERSINTAILKIRFALHDNPDDPHVIETVVGKGYRFIAPITVIAPDSAPAPAANVPPPATVPLRKWQVSAIAGFVLLGCIALLSFVLGRRWLRTVSGQKPIQSIAVLPLANLSGDPAQEYFADGMTEELTTDLGKISGLRVISRTSAMHFKGTRKMLPEIVRELNVDAVLEGGVLLSGNRVRITTQLVEASSDRHLWAQSYERDLRDTLALQDEIARDVANQVKIKLSLQEQIQLAKAHTVNPEAQEAYLKGRYESNKWSEEGLKKSIEYFEQAVQKDSSYAQAWAGLSDAYFLLGVFGFWPTQLAIPKAKEAALKAVELDQTLSEAHLSLSVGKFFLERSWSAAEAELQRAIALNPNNARAHQTHGYHLSTIGRFDEAIAEMRRALDLDPLSPNKNDSLGATFYRAGRYDEALQQWREVPDPNANSERRHRRMAAIYERKGMQKEAITELLTALRLAGKKDLAERVERKYLSSGYSEAKKTFLWGDVRETQRRAEHRFRYDLADDIATDYALLGEKDKAFEWLDKAFREGDIRLIYHKVDLSSELFGPTRGSRTSSAA